MQRSCGRKEHAGRKAQVACAQNDEVRLRLGQTLLKMVSFFLRALGADEYFKLEVA